MISEEYIASQLMSALMMKGSGDKSDLDEFFRTDPVWDEVLEYINIEILVSVMSCVCITSASEM